MGEVDQMNPYHHYLAGSGSFPYCITVYSSDRSKVSQNGAEIATRRTDPSLIDIRFSLPILSLLVKLPPDISTTDVVLFYSVGSLYQ